MIIMKSISIDGGHVKSVPNNFYFGGVSVRIFRIKNLILK
jgi:hypothetical protein